MILLILAVFVVLFVIALIGIEKTYCNDGFDALMTISIIGFLITLVAAIILGVKVTKLNIIDDRIAMHEEENTKIEEQISNVVEEYKKHEAEVFFFSGSSNAGPDAITLISLYPELKSDSLVQSQIEVYIANNKTIKELKEDKINGSVVRWWLYFGG